MICAYDDCKKEFNAKTHNQKYCSDECCRIATNQKLKAAYYEKKARLLGKKRVCKISGCGSLLSRYNEDSVCAKCKALKESKKKKDIVDLLKRMTN